MEPFNETIFEFLTTTSMTAQTRLQIYLESEKNVNLSVTSFSLCIWFLMTTFKEFNALLSYAPSDFADNTLKVLPKPNALLVTFLDEVFIIAVNLTPMKWYHLCFVLSNSSLTTYINNEKFVSNITQQPILLNGSLVIGQEQDYLDGGYTEHQSFFGRVTSLNIWIFELSSNEVSLLGNCGRISKLPHFSWSDFNWNIHNESESILKYQGNPCLEDDQSKYLFFDNKLKWEDTYIFCKTYKLNLLLSNTYEETTKITNLLNIHENCTNVYTAGLYVWLGIKYIFHEEKFIDTNNKTLDHNSLTKKFKIPINKILNNLMGDVPVMQDKDGLWNLDDNNATMCFITRKDKIDLIFYIYLDENLSQFKVDFDLKFIMAAHPKTNDMYFHGLGQYDILKKSNRWCFYNIRDNPKMNNPSICLLSDIDGPPIGRFLWKDMESNKLVNISLGTCTEYEFTCPNGHCIGLEKRCDQHFDCSEGFDEMDCFTTTIKSGYVGQLPSSVPLLIFVIVDIWRIGVIDIHKMAVDIDMTVDIEWIDSRLIFHHLHENVSALIIQSGEKIWSPQPYVRNAISEDKTSFLSNIYVTKKVKGKIKRGEYKEYLGSENPLLERHSLSITFHCDFELHHYPFDNQKCKINFQIVNIGDRSLMFGKGSHVMSFPASLEEYNVGRCDFESQNQTNLFNVTLHFSRRVDYFLFTTFLPTYLLLCIGYGTLLLPEKSFSDRGGMSLTTLLVLIALYAESSNALPKTTYLKAIDVWFVFCIAYLSFVIAIHLATSHVHDPDEVKQGKRPISPLTNHQDEGERDKRSLSPQSKYQDEGVRDKRSLSPRSKYQDEVVRDRRSLSPLSKYQDEIIRDERFLYPPPSNHRRPSIDQPKLEDVADIIVPHFSKKSKRAWGRESLAEIKEVLVLKSKFSKRKRPFYSFKCGWFSNRKILVFSRVLCLIVVIGFVPLYLYFAQQKS